MPRAIRFHSTGDPTTSLVLDSIETPDPGPGQVTVKIRCTPIHPADLNLIAGTYGFQPDLPAIPGSEAFAEIVNIGPNIPDHLNLKPGTPVILRHRTGGTWRDSVTLDAHSITPVPAALDPHQAAMLKINPVTAWRLLHERVTLQPGDWVVQNAANSAVGTALIQIANSLEIRTLNVVRSGSAAETCRQAGADSVIIDGDDFTRRALALTGGIRPALACNAVGGSAAIRLMDFLAPSGSLVTYGAMSRQALKVPNSFLIFKDLTLRGLWVSKWIESAPAAEWTALIENLARLMVAGKLTIPVAATYPADQFPAAITHATQDQRIGKILLDFSA